VAAWHRTFHCDASICWRNYKNLRRGATLRSTTICSLQQALLNTMVLVDEDGLAGKGLGLSKHATLSLRGYLVCWRELRTAKRRQNVGWREQHQTDSNTAALGDLVWPLLPALQRYGLALLQPYYARNVTDAPRQAVWRWRGRLFVPFIAQANAIAKKTGDPGCSEPTRWRRY